MARMAEFKTTASYVPTGDQPTAVATLAEGLEAGDRVRDLEADDRACGLRNQARA